jgi:hypothetical protein
MKRFAQKELQDTLDNKSKMKSEKEIEKKRRIEKCRKDTG